MQDINTFDCTRHVVSFFQVIRILKMRDIVPEPGFMDYLDEEDPDNWTSVTIDEVVRRYKEWYDTNY